MYSDDNLHCKFEIITPMLINRKNNKIKDSERDLYSTTYLLIFMNIWEGSNMGSLISVPLLTVVRSFTKSELIGTATNLRSDVYI